MCVCVFVCMHVCLSLYMSAHVCVYGYVCVCLSLCVYMSVCVCVCVYVCDWMDKCCLTTHRHRYGCVCVCVCVCVYVHVSAWITHIINLDSSDIPISGTFFLHIFPDLINLDWVFLEKTSPYINVYIVTDILNIKHHANIREI